jgi:hypothetical protein
VPSPPSPASPPDGLAHRREDRIPHDGFYVVLLTLTGIASIVPLVLLWCSCSCWPRRPAHAGLARGAAPGPAIVAAGLASAAAGVARPAGMATDRHRVRRQRRPRGRRSGRRLSTGAPAHPATPVPDPVGGHMPAC